MKIELKYFSYSFQGTHQTMPVALDLASDNLAPTTKIKKAHIKSS
jgi:hypothetical protein